jgi:hypothetical protein
MPTDRLFGSTYSRTNRCHHVHNIPLVIAYLRTTSVGMAMPYLQHTPN